ncbi:winged helix-turn-helix domain-containing protein [Ancylothrix sp. C2]|uniref:winged helix-turn-helix domain-containing protein n=1 Tax=Ancylothrix sp. D3o TaxID=2953691 RepID=UPI0021BAC930|nr:winged helix-turn-helix domain-containing protein [Ancylothrix sp. D3o]MCT7952382.1 winged helix-turn-helix domain-containing protein [Ancylothrix sp. D3o]
MTYREAALIVLEASEQLMTVGEITEAGIKRGLIRPEDKTPVFTNMAVLYTDGRDGQSGRMKRIFARRKTRVGPGYVRLGLN